MQTKEPSVGDLLTEEELSALMDVKPKSPTQVSLPERSERRHRVVPYNFRRPDRVSKEQVRSLYLLHDTFANNLSSRLPIFLRAISEVTLISVEQQAYVEYLYGLPNPTVIFTLSMAPLQGMCVLEMNPSVAFPVIDRQLGGMGDMLSDTRAVTEIEQKILEGFLKIAIEDLQTAWKPVIDIDFQVMGCETRPQLLQIVAPNEVVISVVFHVRIAEARGTMSFCIPALALEPVIQKFNQSFYTRVRDVPPEQTRALIDNLSAISFPVAAEVHGTTIMMEDLLRMAAGDVLKLNHRVKEPIEVSVAGLVKFRGDLMGREKRTLIHVRHALQEEERETKYYAG